MFKKILGWALLSALPLTVSAADLDGILAKMDRAAAGFEGMEATITRLNYMGLLGSKDTESGTMYVRREDKDRVRMAIHFTKPYEYFLAVNGDKAEIYRPRIATVEEYNIAKHRNALQGAFLLGFGTSAKYLRDNYDLRVLGEESVGDRNTIRMELIPKSADARKQFPKLEIWVSTQTWHAVQQKLHQPGGEDYRIYSYDAVKLNPKLNDKVFKLAIPKKTKRIFP
jgi:outer membrane lipoprotein-sorting protein